MRKILILATAIITLSMVSCKKAHTCTCTISGVTVTTYDSGNSDIDTYSETYVKTAEKQTKKYFKENSNCYSTTTKKSNSGSGWTSEQTLERKCTLK